MKKIPRTVGKYDVPLDLWPDEPSKVEDSAETSTLSLDRHGAIEGLVDVPRGVSLSLGDRAVALADIMNYYNQANKTRGAKASPGVMSRRYGDRGSYEVVTNMSAKTNDFSRAAKRAFDTLAAESQMVEAGFDADDMLLARQQLERGMTSKYGPGRAYARDRQKVVRRAQKVADF